MGPLKGLDLLSLHILTHLMKIKAWNWEKLNGRLWQCSEDGESGSAAPWQSKSKMLPYFQAGTHLR